MSTVQLVNLAAAWHRAATRTTGKRVKLLALRRRVAEATGVILCWTLALAATLRAAEPSPDLLTVGQPATHARLTAISSGGELTFRTASGEEIKVPVDGLVRWSAPVASRGADEVLLVDGSMLRLKPAWGKEPSFGAGQAGAKAQSVSVGEVALPRWCFRAVLWGLPPDAAERQVRLQSLLEAQSAEPGSDLVLLENGDSFAGTVTAVGDGGNPFGEDEADSSDVVNVWNPFGETPLPLARVRGIALSPDTSVPPLPNDAVIKPPLKVGLSDGSLIGADALAGVGELVKLSSRLVGERQVDLKNIVSIQADSDRIAYLSDLEAASYRSEPYLDLEWPYQRDRNVIGGRPRVGGRQYLKAIGMHSASRLTFDLDGGYERFAAAVAIDDAAEGGGSVVFRVLLSRGGEWREAYASEVIRGGQPPREVAVDLEGAEQLALAVDYADRGDERDYANWLDARLERVGD